MAAGLETPPVWLNYLDIEAEVKPWINITNLSGDTLTTQLQIVTDYACTWVQNYLQRPVAPTEIFERLDGWTGLEGAYLMLKYFPVIEVTLVNEYWGTNGLHTLTEQTPTDQSAQDSFQIEYRTGRLIRSFPGLVPRPFFPGSRNIEVTYTAGFQTVPADIRMATLEMAKYWYRRSFDPRQNSRGGDYDTDTGAELWPGIPNRVTEILDPYRNVILV